MSKEAVFTMKLESKLRTEFMAEVEASHRPASPDYPRPDARIHSTAARKKRI